MRLRSNEFGLTPASEAAGLSSLRRRLTNAGSDAPKDVLGPITALAELTLSAKGCFRVAGPESREP